MTSDDVKLTFLGGAGTVTGSKILVEFRETKILIDCGLFQGLKDLRLLNRKPIDKRLNNLSTVLLTHAHLDHSGYLPVLAKNGFKGPIHCTHPTAEITKIILEDSAKIQEEEAEKANQHGYSKHAEATPLYNRKDAHETYSLFVGHNNSEWVIIQPDFKFQFHHSGHILGAAMIELVAGSKTIIFSGDIGREHPLLLYPPKHIKHADIVVMESTYGNRLHSKSNPAELLSDIVNHTAKKGGSLIIPTFAVERAQEIMFLLVQLKEAGKIPNLDIYLDSPMAVNTTQVFFNYPEWHLLLKENIQLIQNEVKFISDYKVSQEIVNSTKQKIVLAGSGMITGGRVLHYLDKMIDNPKNSVLLPGFQAEGTRGRALVEREHEIKFFGEYHQVKAEIFQMESLSAHADQKDIINWIAGFRSRPEKIILNHGEPQASNSLRVKLKDTFDLDVEVANLGESFMV